MQPSANAQLEPRWRFMPDVATSPAPAPFRALIAGGGVAGLEAAFALQAIAPDSVEVSVLAPDTEFSYRPMSVREPFSYAPARRYPLAPIVSDAGAALVPGALSWVDPDQRVVHTATGEAIEYDALLLAVGARGHVGIEHASTVDDRRIDEILRGLIQDIEDGYVHSVAFVMPSEKCWPLPLYELALMTAERAFAMCVDVHVTIVTPERSPLAVFGEEASSAVSALLDERNRGRDERGRPQHVEGPHRHTPREQVRRRRPDRRAAPARRARHSRAAPDRRRLHSGRQELPCRRDRSRLRRRRRHGLSRQARRALLAAGRYRGAADRPARRRAWSRRSRFVRRSTACC